MLVRVGEKWELCAADDPTSSQHNTDCTDLKGQRGFDTLDQRKALEKQFRSAASSARPREPLSANPSVKLVYYFLFWGKSYFYQASSMLECEECVVVAVWAFFPPAR